MTGGDRGGARRGAAGRVGLALAMLVAVILVAVVAFTLGRAGTNDLVPPVDTSADAGFARDMQVHHDQGVELAMLIRDRTSDVELRRLAYDIATTQAQQSGQLYGWLTLWGLPQAASEPSMTWMTRGGSRNGGMDMGSGSDARGSIAPVAAMPGLATPQQVATLTGQSGVDAERTFLTLMIAHHHGAIQMAEAVLDRAHDPAVLGFARSVIASQRPEIDAMTRMLAARTP